MLFAIMRFVMAVIKGNQMHPSTGTVTVGTVKTIIAPKLDTTELGYKCFTLYNSGPATFVSGLMEYSPDGNIWGTLNATTFVNIGSAELLFFQWQNDSLRFFRFSGAVAAGSVATAVFWWTF